MLTQENIPADRTQDGLAEAVAFLTGLPAYFQEPTQPVYVAAVSDLSMIELFRQPDCVAPDAAYEAFAQSRTAALIGRALADEYGWKVGDRIPLHSPTVLTNAEGGSTWEIEVVGIADGRDEHAPTRMAFVHYEYIDQMRFAGRNTVSAYFVAAESHGNAGDDPGRPASRLARSRLRRGAPPATRMPRHTPRSALWRSSATGRCARWQTTPWQ